MAEKRDRDNKMAGREVIFEFRPVGNVMRVSAMDTETAIEVVIQCPLSAGEAIFQQNALKKLEYMLRRQGKIE